MQKKVLSEKHYIMVMWQCLKIGTLTEINYKRYFKITNYRTPFPFSRTWDMLNTYMRDHIGLEYGINLINKETWGNMYKPQETTIPLLNIDPVDLRNSPDFTLLYGVKVKDCMVRIHYEDNRRKGRSWDIPLKIINL